MFLSLFLASYFTFRARTDLPHARHYWRIVIEQKQFLVADNLKTKLRLNEYPIISVLNGFLAYKYNIGRFRCSRNTCCQ